MAAEFLPLGVSPSRDVTSDRDNLETVFGGARNAHRIARFPPSAGAGAPILWRFRLRPLESVAKRVLFSCYAAGANKNHRPKSKNPQPDFLTKFQRLKPPFLRFT